MKKMTEKERLQIKVNLAYHREKGMITRMDVFELADSIDYSKELTNRAADRMIAKAAELY